MEKRDKMYDTSLSFISGVILVVLGIIIIIFNKQFYINAINILLIFILINSFLSIVKSLLKREKNNNNLVIIFLNTLFVLILIIIPSIPQSFFPMLFSVYLILYSFIKLIVFLISYKDYKHYRFKEIFYSIFYFIIGMYIFLFPMKYINILLLILGIYFIVLGSFFELNAIYVNIPIKLKNKIKRKIKVQLPVWLEAIIPYTVFYEINNLVEVDGVKNKLSKEKLHKIKPDMEVLVHVSGNGFNRIGHVDIIYNNNWTIK